MKTFTTYAEKKAKQFLNLLQGYTKGIRMTATLILLLMGVSNAWGAVNHTGGYVYFLKPSTWTESKVMMFIGHNSYTSVYEMTKVSNTDNLYRYTMPSWDGATYVAFANAESVWGTGEWGPDQRKNAPHYTNVYNDYRFDSGSYYVVVPANTSNNAGITINYKSSASNLNLTTEAIASDKAHGTVSVSGYYMSAYNTASTRSAVSSSASNATASTTLAPGSTATFKATASTGYEFEGWYDAATGGNQLSTNSTYTFKYDISYTGKTIYARFKAKTYTVTFDNQGATTAGAASVTATYNAAMPSIANNLPKKTGYTFNGYFDATSGGNQYYKADGTSARTWDKTTDTELYAQWTINQYTIYYGVVGSANGAIQLDGGTKVTTSSSATANYNTNHTFTAEPANDYKIEGWYSDANGANKIDAAGTNNTYEIASLTADTYVYVKFVETAEVMSQVTVTATEGGTVSPSGTVEVGNKTSSTFTATPDPGYRFDQWAYSGSIVKKAESNTNEQGSITITATSTGTLTARFVRVHTVNFFATPAAAGTATATVGGNAITSGDKIDANASIIFTAAVANAYNGQCTFLRWVDGAGETLSTETTYTHTVEEDITVKAIFKINQYTLTFSASEGGHVSAKANNSAIASPATLDYNTSVTLTAEPDAGSAFDGWYEGSTKKSSETSYSITLTADKTIEARFTKGTTVYMKAIEYWKKDHPRYAIYYWGAGDKNGWVDMTNVDCNGDIYEGYVPAGYTNFKFVRLAPSTSNDWANKWSETADLTTTNNDGKMYIQPHVYLKPNSNWKSDGARFAAYFFKKGDDAFGKTWMGMSDTDGDGIYSCEIPTDKLYPNVIFCRMNPAFDTNDWDRDDNDYVWNQTGDLNINTYTLFTITNWGEGSWSAGPHKNGWQTYAEPSYKITYSNPANGTITVTKAGNNVASGTSLNMGDEIKITFTPADGYELINYNVDYATETGEEGVYTVCGPTKITAEFAEAGTARTVYLRPNEDWLRDEPIFAAYAWNSNSKAEYHWYIMTTKADDYTGAYSCNISSTYDWVIFVRLKPAGRDGSDGSLDFKNAWNQTKNLAIIDKDNDKTNDHKLRFAIGDKVGGEGEDKEKYDGKWEENTPIWGLTANFNDWTAEKAVFKGYPGHLDVMPPFGTSHEFKLYNFVYENNKYHGNAGTMKRANSGQWWTMNASEQANCQMMLDVKGDYIYQMRFLTVGYELRKQISVTYPEADTKYALLYKDNRVSRISYDIPAVDNEQNDTISFFVDKDANPTIKLLVNTTETGNAIQVSVSESGVYNFILQQNGGEVTVIATNPEPYKGYYYIRTDAASGGWGGYKQDGNKMTYNSYADKSQNFDHYYCKWICNHSDAEHKDFRAYTNVKFCVANDYSHKLSDELDGDEIIEKAEVPTGCLPEDANVRFGWHSKTNELSRAYIAGATTATKETFLHIIDAEDLKNSEGTTVTDINFTDLQNWIYQVDVKATKATKIKLVADYAEKRQYFKGTEGNGEETKINLLSSTAQNVYDIRLIYNFKCNHLVAAMILNGDKEVTENDALGADMMVIRKDQASAEQLTFNPNTKELSEVGTVYSVMTFTKDHILDNDLSERARSLYWVSFPFDVKVSDVFGFGEYAEHWILQYYDGAERAEKGLFSDSGTYWKYIFDTDTTLNAGEGYVLVLDLNKIEFLHGAEEVSLYFPSTEPVKEISGELSTPATIPAHECTIDREWTEGGTRYHHKYTDSHWNLIGVPGFADIDFDLSTTGYHFMQDDASFYYNFNLAESTYAVEASHVTKFQAMYAYMVQFAGTINWTSSEVLGVAPPELVAPRNSDAEPERVVLRLEVAQGEEVADRTFVQLQQEGATANFDLSLDLTKIMNSGFSNIYTLTDSLKIQVAGNALPMEETVVPVGVNIATAGEYTFRMPDGTEGMVVELIDYEANTTTNLLLDDYTVNLPTGSNETRFALSIKPEKTATNVGNIGGTMNDGQGVRKFIIDGKLYLQKDGMLYDAQGHSVQ